MASTFSSPSAPGRSSSGIAIWADTRALARLARDIRKASPEAWKACRVALRVAAQPIKDDAVSRARGFSKRIPGSIRIRITAGGNIKIVAGGAGAPDAAPIENRGRGHVRHPIPRSDQWTDKNSPPAFLAPAFEAHKEAALKAVEEAVSAAVLRVVKGGGA